MRKNRFASYRFVYFHLHGDEVDENGRIKLPWCIEKMIKELSTSHVLRRYLAAERLAIYGARAEPALGALTLTLLHDEYAIVRTCAARALGRLGTSRALDALLRASAEDPDREVRLEAEQAIMVCRGG